MTRLALAAVVYVVGTGFAAAQNLPPDFVAKARRYCGANPDDAQCKELRAACIEGWRHLAAEERGACEALGYTPHAHANAQIGRAASRCSGNTRADCVEVRKACREQRVTCDMMTSLACAPGESGAYCDRALLCTPAAIDRMCTSHTERGAKYLVGGLRYTYIDGDDAGHVVSLGGVGHGQWEPRGGLGGFGVAYGIDFDLGWYITDGFAYDAELFMGLGWRAGKAGMIGALVGAGLSGIYDGILANAYTVSGRVVALADLNLGYQVAVHATPTWVFKSASREAGSELLGDRADELAVGISIIGVTERVDEGEFTVARGWAIGAVYQEIAGTRFVGVFLGSGTSDASR